MHTLLVCMSLYTYKQYLTALVVGNLPMNNDEHVESQNVTKSQVTYAGSTPDEQQTLLPLANSKDSDAYTQFLDRFACLSPSASSILLALILGITGNVFQSAAISLLGICVAAVGCCLRYQLVSFILLLALSCVYGWRRYGSDIYTLVMVYSHANMTHQNHTM